MQEILHKSIAIYNLSVDQLSIQCRIAGLFSEV